jgi:hypothetical protein
MSDLAPLLLPRAPLPRHLYGTREALFYLLREAAPLPAALAPPPLVGIQDLPQTARVVPILPRPARPSLGDLLHSDSFDFRGLGDPV